MLTKHQLKNLLAHETNVIKHLAASLPAGSDDWKPTENQRSVLDLLRYMTLMGETMAVWLVSGNFDHTAALNERAKTITRAHFADAMDAQLEKINDVLDELDLEGADERMVNAPWQEEMPFSELLIRSLHSMYSAYRMQLFLYAKGAGNHELSTFDCWLGRSAPEGM